MKYRNIIVYSDYDVAIFETETFKVLQESFDSAMERAIVERIRAEELIDGKWELIREHCKEL